jgi:hypothetical protein
MSLYFPSEDDGSWETVAPRTLGWNTAALDEVLAYAEQHHSNQVVILEAGRCRKYPNHHRRAQ